MRIAKSSHTFNYCNSQSNWIYSQKDWNILGQGKLFSLSLSRYASLSPPTEGLQSCIPSLVTAFHFQAINIIIIIATIYEMIAICQALL